LIFHHCYAVGKVPPAGGLCPTAFFGRLGRPAVPRRRFHARGPRLDRPAPQLLSQLTRLAFCCLPPASCRLPSAFCCLPSASCLLPSASRLPLSTKQPGTPPGCPANPCALSVLR